MPWECDICCFPWNLDEVSGCGQQLVPHYWVSYDSKGLRRTPYKYWRKDLGWCLIVAGKYAPCGWWVVQMDTDDDDIPWYGMFSTILVCIDVQRIIKRANMSASYLALVRSSGPARKKH